MKKGLEKRGLFYFDGRGDRIRTYDPLVPNQMRYQAALRPEAIIVTHNVVMISSNSKQSTALKGVRVVTLALNLGASSRRRQACRCP